MLVIFTQGITVNVMPLQIVFVTTVFGFC